MCVAALCNLRATNNSSRCHLLLDCVAWRLARQCVANLCALSTPTTNHTYGPPPLARPEKQLTTRCNAALPLLASQPLRWAGARRRCGVASRRDLCTLHRATFCAQVHLLDTLLSVCLEDSASRSTMMRVAVIIAFHSLLLFCVLIVDCRMIFVLLLLF